MKICCFNQTWKENTGYQELLSNAPWEKNKYEGRYLTLEANESVGPKVEIGTIGEVIDVESS